MRIGKIAHIIADVGKFPHDAFRHRAGHGKFQIIFAHKFRKSQSLHPAPSAGEAVRQTIKLQRLVKPQRECKNVDLSVNAFVAKSTKNTRVFQEHSIIFHRS